MNKNKSLPCKANLMLKTDYLSEKPKTVKTTRDGLSDMLMLLGHSQLQVTQRAGECILIDHSISKPDYQVEDSWIQSPTEWLSRPEMEDQPKNSTSNIRPELSRVRVMLVLLTTMLWMLETLGHIFMEPTANGINSSSLEKVNTSSIRRANILMPILRMQKENSQPQMQRMKRFTKNGELSIKIKHPIKLNLDRCTKREVCTLIDHSSLYQECG
jgi:hypothetical protein